MRSIEASGRAALSLRISRQSAAKSVRFMRVDRNRFLIYRRTEYRKAANAS